MKIILVINVDFSLRHFLLPLMRAARARGHEVVGACAEGPLLDDVRAEGFRIIPMPFVRRAAPLAQWRALWALVAMLRAEKPDIVHGHMPISGLLARFAAKIAGVPRIAYTCHGFLFNQPGPLPRRAASLLLEFLAGQITDVYLTVSEREAAEARRLWISRHAVATGNGRDPARFHPDPATRARIRAELGVPPDQVVVIIIARLVALKGFPDLAVAMAHVANAELWVVGERLATDRGPDVAAMLRGAGLGARLRLLGYRADTEALLAAADIATLPSDFEGLPMSVIEAMLTGLPVIGTPAGGMPEQIIDGQTGLIVPYHDPAALTAALQRLADDAGLRERMGAAGRARALARYTEAAVLDRTLDLLGL